MARLITVWVVVPTTALLLCMCSPTMLALMVRETEHNVAFINIPIAQTVLQQFLNDDLQPIVYNDSAWLAIVPFEIYSLEAEIDRMFVPTPGMKGTTIVKTVAFVMRKDGSNRGYMILDMDFSSEFQKLSCSVTQPGVNCYHSVVSNINDSYVSVTTQDKLTLKATYGNASVLADPSLVAIATELHWKYEQKGVKGAWSATNQTGHVHKPATAITLTSFQSNIIEHRHGWSGEAAVCQRPGMCFLTPMIQFIDKEQL